MASADKHVREGLVKKKGYSRIWQPESSSEESDSDMEVMDKEKQQHQEEEDTWSPLSSTPSSPSPALEAAVQKEGTTEERYAKKLRQDMNLLSERVFDHMDYLTEQLQRKRKDDRLFRDHRADSRAENGELKLLQKKRQVEGQRELRLILHRLPPQPSTSSRAARKEISDTERQDQLASLEQVKRERNLAEAKVVELQMYLRKLEAQELKIVLEKDGHVTKQAQLASMILGKEVSKDEMRQEEMFQEVVHAAEKLKRKAAKVYKILRDIDDSD